jgi:polar amino acid transport system permease protein
MSYQWRFDVVAEELPRLWDGLQLTVVLAVAGFVLSASFAVIVVLARISPLRALRWPAIAYINFFRGTPFIVQLLWLYYTLPIATGIALSSVSTALIGITLNLGAFIAETYRAGITSIEKGQHEAAAALGMTPFQRMTRIIFPQALARIIPPLASYWVTIFKDTSLFSLVAVAELTHASRGIALDTYRPLEVYTVVAILYFVLTYPQARFVDWLFDRYRVRS